MTARITGSDARSLRAFADGNPGALAPQLTAAVGSELLAAQDVTGLTLSS